MKKYRFLILLYYLGYLGLFPMLQGSFHTAHGYAVSRLGADIILCAVIITVCLQELDTEWSSFRNDMKKNLVVIAAGTVIMLVINFIFSAASGGIVSAAQDMHLKTAESHPVLFVLQMVVSGPLIEEGIFRMSVHRLLKKYRILISTAVCALTHVLPGILSGSPAGILFILPYGISAFLLAYIYERRKNIYTCISVHALYNLAACIGYL